MTAKKNTPTVVDVRTAKMNVKQTFPRVSNRFTPDRDTMPHMTAAANQAVTDLTDLFGSMTDEEISGASKILTLMNQYKSSAGYKRLFGLTFPTVAANLEVGPPTE